MLLQITIQITDQGACQVGGNIDNPMQAFGLLEIGRQALADHYRKQSERLVQPVSIGPSSFKLD